MKSPCRIEAALALQKWLSSPLARNDRLGMRLSPRPFGRFLPSINPLNSVSRRMGRRLASSAKPKLDPKLSKDMIGPYGLRRVDYSKPPRLWPLAPPPPASKSKIERYFPVFIAAIALTGGIWIYFNRNDQVYDYWKQVDQGNVPLDGFGDDDDDDDEWEDRK